MAKKKKKELKLNSMRVLEAQGVPYEVFTYPPQRHSAVEVAELAGVPPAQVYKTLVVQREEGKPLLVVIAGDRELDLKRLAAAIGEKKLWMASHRDAERLTRLKVGGISPLALLNRGFDIYADQAVTQHGRVYISAGQRGVNLRVAVEDLLRITGARLVEAIDCVDCREGPMTLLRDVTEGTAHVFPAEPRETVQITLDDGRIFEGPVAATLEDFFKVAYPDPPIPIVGALVNQRLRELTFQVLTDTEVAPITMGASDGMRIYRRSLSFLLVVAVHELFPGTRLFVDHSFTFGGYFCQIEGREPFTQEELDCLEKRMREIVEQDEPIVKARIPLDEAQEMFRRLGHVDRIRLLKYRHKDYLTTYKLRGLSDYFYGYMVPSTGYLRWFELTPYFPGFILRFPRRHWPTTLQPYRDYPKLIAVFREYGEWMNVVDVRDVGGLNEAFENGRVRELILVAEALHQQRIAQIAQQIAARRDQVRLVLIAGPSASGKTTFSKRLAVHLLANGIRPKSLGLDDYFVDRDKTPRDENGQYDFETLEALDLELLNAQLLAMMSGHEVTLPHFNFKTGLSEQGETVKLRDDHVLLVEGIHGLNPRLVPHIPQERIFRIYVSALTQLNIDMHNRVPTTDTRLIRRIVRDATYRGYTATDTINRWESVRRGEKRYIFPHQEHADVMFNSALVYELAVLKPFAAPLLREIDPWTPQYNEGRRLLAFLEWFNSCPPDLIPDNSILREFIGGSILRDFTL